MLMSIIAVTVALHYALVQDVQLLRRCVLLQQLAGDLALCSEHNAILGQDA